MRKVEYKKNTLPPAECYITCLSCSSVNLSRSIDSRFVSDLVLQILSYVAQKERENIKARQAQGIEAAKAQGKALGRPRATYPNNWTEIYDLWYNKKEITAKEAMERLGLKRNTFYKLAGEDRRAHEIH